MQRKVLTTIQKSVLFLGLFFIISLFSVQKSYGEAAITVGDDVKIKFGVLFQGQLDETQTSTGDYMQNIFLRRVRFLIGGQLAPNLTFFMETDNPNLGKEATSTAATNSPAKNINTSNFNTLDAFLTWKPVDPLNLDMGLFYVPLCRNCVQGAAMLLPINYGANSFNESNATGSNTGRDAGLQARSYLLNDKLEIRLGAFQGYRKINVVTATSNTGSTDPFRMAARVQYNVFETEKGLFYTGTYLGKKKVLAVGAGYDAQGEYKANAFDAFLDLPIAGNMAVTTQVDYIRYMPGTPAQYTVSITGGDQTDWLVEAGLYLSDLKLQPFVQYQDQQFVLGGPDTRIVQGGLAYYFAGYNGNLKLGAGYTDTGTTYTNQVTVQLQGFYF